ncbi:hypothetical protein MTO96_024119 [Rhipicephalus appendiculatus]
MLSSTLGPLVANVTSMTLRVTRDQSVSRIYSNSTPTSHLNLTTGHGDSEEFVPYEQRLETYVVPTLFAFIFLVGLLGNGTLILVFIRNRTMRSVPNIYIMSLSLGDFIVIRRHCAVHQHHLHSRLVALRALPLQAQRVSSGCVNQRDRVDAHRTQH